MKRTRTRSSGKSSPSGVNRIAPPLVFLAYLLLGFKLLPAQQPQPDAAELYSRIAWTSGPAEVNLGGVARLQVPTGYRFTGAAGAQIWMELCGNPPDGILGVVIPPFDTQAVGVPPWYLALYYDDIGHVSDDEKNDLDEKTVTVILEALRNSTEQANLERQRHGWTPIHVVGWHQPPFYDAITHNLTWAVKATSAETSNVNYDSRLLGRRGVMRVKMVLNEADVSATVPTYRMLVSGLSFQSGETHAEFRKGDKVAQYGLVGLVTGGAAVVAVKAWKPLVALAALIVAAVAAAFKKVATFCGRRGSPATANAAAAVSGGASGGGGGGGAHERSSGWVLIPCPRCKRMNRIANQRISDRPKCGGCGCLLVG